MAVHESRVVPIGDDPRAQRLVNEAQAVLGVDISGLQIADAYYLEGALAPEQHRTITSELFANPIIQQATTEPRQDWDNPHIVEVAYRPGVQDPAGASIVRGAGLFGVTPDAVGTGKEYRFPKSVAPEVVERVLSELVVNETVHTIRRRAPDTFIIKAETPPIETIAISNMTDEELTNLSAQRKLALNLRTMQIIQAYSRRIGRNLTDGEVEALAAWRSDHCAHTTFGAELTVNGRPKNPLMKRIRDRSKPHFANSKVLSAFEDNSGVIAFYGEALNLKGETHISPYNIEAYGGAATGIGGLQRDIVATGRGAEMLVSTNIWGMPPRGGEHQLSRGLAGVREYGNPMGIPTSNGAVYEHPLYQNSKSMILVGGVGKMRMEDVPKGEPRHGDRVIVVGGRTGRDGVHGATMSTEDAKEDTHVVHAGAVQIGDPIVQQKLFELVREASELGLFRATTDCGAAGLSSAVGEMAEKIGVWVDISRLPLKYEGLAPWEKWLSESQERLVMAVPDKDIKAFSLLCRKYEVEMTDLGFFGTLDGEPRLEVKHGEDTLIDLDYDFLNNGFPPETFEAEWTPPDVAEIAPDYSNLGNALELVLGHTNVCSKQAITRGYDHGVKAMHVNAPYGGPTGDAPSNASVLRPIRGRPYGAVFGQGANMAISVLDPAAGSAAAFAEAIANVVAAGADPRTIVVANNYIGPTPNKRVLGGLDIQVDTVMDCVDAYGAPVISGKDSNSSSAVRDGTRYESPAFVNIMALGTMPNVFKMMTTYIKKPGSTLVLVGEMDYQGMGGSVFYDVRGGSSARVPQVNLAVSPKVNQAIYNANQKSEILACHDVSSGGVAATVAEMCMGSDYGARLHLPEEIPAANSLFNETAGCYVVEVSDDNTAKKLFKNVPHRILGTTIQQSELIAWHESQVVFSRTTAQLREAWKTQKMEVIAA